MNTPLKIYDKKAITRIPQNELFEDAVTLICAVEHPGMFDLQREERSKGYIEIKNFPFVTECNYRTYKMVMFDSFVTVLALKSFFSAN